MTSPSPDPWENFESVFDSPDNSVRIRVATANVGTLRQKKCEAEAVDITNGAGRAQLLELDLDVHDVDICGLQEGRAAETQQITGVVFEQFIAAADSNGCYGPQVWARRSSSLRVLSFMARSPRILEVTVARGGEVWLVISAHAPVENAPACDKNVFLRRPFDSCLEGEALEVQYLDLLGWECAAWVHLFSLPLRF